MARNQNTFQVSLANPLRVALHNVKPKSQLCFAKNMSRVASIKNTLDNNLPRTKRIDQFIENMSTILPSNHEEVIKPCFNNMNKRKMLAKSEVPLTYNVNRQGSDIINFLKDKHILITGGTGFLGKVLVEKILRVQPKIGKIYLLIKAKDASHAMRRVHDEFTLSPLFSLIRSHHMEKYEKFMQQKIIPLVGDVGSDDLGMNNDTIQLIRDKLSIIVHSAATTTFDERYDVALNLNTHGAHRVVEFSKTCPNIQLLMHMSTAFVNGGQGGVAYEKAFKVGYSLSNERLNQGQAMKQDIDFDLEKDIIHEKIKSLNNENRDGETLSEALKALGLARSKHFGWQDTYTFTKAMGEMLIDSNRDDLPIVIVRPGVVESSFKEPFPGWIEGNRMMDPIIISYGKGLIRGFFCDPNSVLDVVPVDMVVNAMLAAMAKHASQPGLEVYHMTSSNVNPLCISKLGESICGHYQETPFIGNDGKPISTKGFHFYQSVEELVKDVSHAHMDQKESRHKTTFNPSVLKQYIEKATKQVTHLANIYQPYTFYGGRFDSSKTQGLHAKLSSDERTLFGFNVNEIDWETYLKRIHIPGLRKHVLKGRGSSI